MTGPHSAHSLRSVAQGRLSTALDFVCASLGMTGFEEIDSG